MANKTQYSNDVDKNFAVLMKNHCKSKFLLAFQETVLTHLVKGKTTFLIKLGIIIYTTIITLNSCPF